MINGRDIFADKHRSDQSAPAMVRREDAMITGKIDPRLRYQGCQSCNEIHRIEGHLGCSVSVRRLQGVNHLARRAE